MSAPASAAAMGVVARGCRVDQRCALAQGVGVVIQETHLVAVADSYCATSKSCPACLQDSILPCSQEQHNRSSRVASSVCTQCVCVLPRTLSLCAADPKRCLPAPMSEVDPEMDQAYRRCTGGPSWGTVPIGTTEPGLLHSAPEAMLIDTKVGSSAHRLGMIWGRNLWQSQVMQGQGEVACCGSG